MLVSELTVKFICFFSLLKYVNLCFLGWAINFNIGLWNCQRHKPRNNDKQTKSDLARLYMEGWKEHEWANWVQALTYTTTNSVPKWDGQMRPSGPKKTFSNMLPSQRRFSFQNSPVVTEVRTRLCYFDILILYLLSLWRWHLICCVISFQRKQYTELCWHSVSMGLGLISHLPAWIITRLL